MVARFKTALATASQTGGQVQTSLAWPGPATEDESVFLGYHPELQDLRLSQSNRIPNIKAGRKQGAESYTVPVTVWSFRPDVTVEDAGTARDRAFSMAGLIYDTVANDPRLGLAPTTVTSIQVSSTTKTLWPFKAGWACEVLIEFDVEARIQ